MNFSKLTKRVDTNNYMEILVNINQIKAQYNPDRFRYWQALHEGPEKEVLNMLYSPHYRLLTGGDGVYYRMQKLYGRNDKWIRKKIEGLRELFNSIKKEGMQENITILNKPLVKNKYNGGFEIFEGHHRLACCLVLGMKEIICNVIGDVDEHN